MQIINLSTSPNVFISMPVEALIDAGIEPGDAFEIGVEDEKIIRHDGGDRRGKWIIL
jgi:hypothetical protein